MAGIGFELRKMLSKDSYSSLLRAYGYSAIIGSGPWIISIVSIVIVSYLLAGAFGSKEVQLFTASITHVYAFSLILVGPLQLVLTRFAADQLSARRPEAIFPSFLAALTVAGAVGGVGGLLFFGFGTDASIVYQLSAAGLMVYVCCIFIASNYLTALLDYRQVVSAFFIGYVLSGLLAYVLGITWGMQAAMFGFTAGHAVLFLLLFRALKNGLGSDNRPSWEVISYFKRFPSLLFCGLMYNLGIWVDKLLFWWFSDQHEQVNGLIFSARHYDVGIYLSLLSIVPGMAVFFLKIETDFAERFQSFFGLVEKGGTLDQLVEKRDEIARSLGRGFLNLFAVQGIVTAFLVVFADHIPAIMSISAIQLGIFRVTLFGAFLLVIFLSLLTILFYFDDRKGALWCTSAFVVANIVGSWATLQANEAWYGFGFVIAAGLAMVIAGWRVNSRLARLEYHVFTSSQG
jgi:uncharacterized membrane protein